MGVPTSEVVYTIATTRRETTKVHKKHVVALEAIYIYYEYMTRKLIDEYELWGLKLDVKKTKYMAIGDTSRDLQLEDGKG